MSRDLNYLKSLHRISVFDDSITFYDYVVVDRRTQRIAKSCTVDSLTGKLHDDKPLPAKYEIANHRYFWNGIPVRGSVTALSLFYFDKFDADAQAHRIASGERIFTDKQYKYYHIGREKLALAWADLRRTVKGGKWLHATVDPHYAAMSGEVDSGDVDGERVRTATFRAVHDPFVKRCIITTWEENRDRAGAVGTEMHMAIQLYYEKQFNRATTPGGQTKAFEQFLNFHKTWVRPRNLSVLRTELSMFDPYSQLNGTIDVIYKVDRQYGNGEPMDVVVADWKCTVDTRATSFNPQRPEFGNPPFSDWPLCKTSERWLQLMVYAKIFADNTGGRYRVISAHIVAFHDERERFSVQDVPLHEPGADTRIQIVFDEQNSAKRTALESEKIRLMAESDQLHEVSCFDVAAMTAELKRQQLYEVMAVTRRLLDVNVLLDALERATRAHNEAKSERHTKRRFADAVSADDDEEKSGPVDCDEISEEGNE